MKSRATNANYVNYIGETGRKFDTRLSEHQKDAKIILQVYTESERKSSVKSFNKSALADHIAKTNHVLDWEGAEEVENQTRTSQRSFQDQTVSTRYEPGPGRVCVWAGGGGGGGGGGGWGGGEVHTT